MTNPITCILRCRPASCDAGKKCLMQWGFLNVVFCCIQVSNLSKKCAFLNHYYVKPKHLWSFWALFRLFSPKTISPASLATKDNCSGKGPWHNGGNDRFCARLKTDISAFSSGLQGHLRSCLTTLDSSR
jgi:hypothetical protein